MTALALCSAVIPGALALEDAYIPWGDSRYLGSNDNIIDSNFPVWLGAAFKTGSGVWDTNIPAWYVSPEDSNEAALGVLFSRALLSNSASLIMKLGYQDSSNSSLFLDMLLVTNQSVVVTNLFSNILTGSGLGTSRIFNVSLADTNAIGLQFRRGVGSITVYDTLLSPDSDGDNFSDMEEAVWGSDPGSALSVPCASITGQVYYAGVQSGVIHVLAATNANDWASAHYLTMTLPLAAHVAPFTLPGLPLRRTYYARAWRDVNDNQAKDYWEPSGAAVPVSLYLNSNTGNVVIVMSDPDTDGDGMADVDELILGMDPLTSNTYARLPFIEGFETNTVHLGDVNGQHGWIASPTNEVFIQTNSAWEGVQALAIKAGDTPANVCQLFAVSNSPVIWIDAYIQAFEAAASTNDVSGSAMMFFDANGYLKTYDGLITSSNKWVTLTNVPSVGTTGAWVRLTTKLDYDAQRWLVCVDRVLAAEGLGFASPVSRFSMVSLKGMRGGMDALSISTNEPSGLSLDGDRMPDAWEQTSFGNLGQTDNGDVDGDGLSNLQEYRHQTDPNVIDTDHDGMADGWEITYGLNPNNPADAALDTDGDGLSNLGECAAGTNPRNASSHCWSVSGRVDYAGMQTGVIWIAACTSPTGWPVVGQTANTTTGNYVIANLPPGSNYWVKAWRDTDGNGSNDSWEAWGAFTSHSISLFTNVTGINFALSDPDSDGDGMPDWWEIAHGFNPTNAMDAVLDADGDGLNNRAEYQHGTDPNLADTDHDGVNDGTEVQFGSDPRVVTVCSQLPFIERFETNTVHLGDVNGQNGWIAGPSNTVMVQTGTVWEGAQALALKSADAPANVSQLFAVSNASVVWIDVHVQARESATPTNPPSGSAMMFFDGNGYLKVYDGLCAASNKWVSLTNIPSSGTTGAWVRLSTKLDYGAQQWLVCVDGLLAAEGLGFASTVTQFTAVSLRANQGGLDALTASTNMPMGLSWDNNSMPNDWEITHFGNLDQTDSGDPDYDGVSNLEEYRHGTDPTSSDTDHDAMPDGWEITHGFNPTNAEDAVQDTDGDGIPNQDECRRNTDPGNAQNANITLYVDAAIGNDGNYGITPTNTDVLGPKRTVPAALDASVDGDVVQAAPGQYTGGNPVWNVRGKTIRLVPRGTMIVK